MLVNYPSDYRSNRILAHHTTVLRFSRDHASYQSTHANTMVVSCGCESLQCLPMIDEMSGNVNIPPAHSLVEYWKVMKTHDKVTYPFIAIEQHSSAFRSGG